MNWKHSGPCNEIAPPASDEWRSSSTVALADGPVATDGRPSMESSPRGDRRRGLIDGCGRRIDRLRLSVTPACDLQCVYCRPAKEAPAVERAGFLSDQQRVEFVRFLHEWYGLSHVRITGGEPLVYRSVVSLVAAIRRISKDLSMAMTTHGGLLYRYGFELRQAGLQRLNVSLDSLDRQRYHRMTGGNLDEVLEGLESARVVGFPPPKINTVVLRGMNDDELIDLARWAMARGSEIRFLEAMPIGPAAGTNRRAFVSAAQIKSTLESQLVLDPIPGHPGDTAMLFRATDGAHQGIVGLINPVTQPFCGECRRIRLTADGQLFPCLLDGRHVDLKPAWSRGDLDATEADRLIQAAVARKQPQGTHQSAPMVSLGG